MDDSNRAPPEDILYEPIRLMKVLHIYPGNDSMVTKHVTMLAEGMRLSADIRTADNSASARQLLREQEPDIVHCHGCWQYFVARTAASAIRQGARVILTLHGQLEPWVISQQSMQDKVCKSMLWQRDAVRRAYAVITLGRLERENFKHLGWNPRIEEIHNAVITNTISPSEMVSQTFAVYQKVMDSNTLELMDEIERRQLATILKAGLTGDRRWIGNEDVPGHVSRQLLIYAEHEGIRNYVDYGINLLGLSAPLIDTEKIAAYMPPSYTRPRPIKEIIGDYEGNETDYLLRIITQLHKAPLLLHLTELARELYRDSINDEHIAAMLEERGLLAFTQRLMQILSEQLLLDEGYMPVDPINDRQTQRIRKIITSHLKI